MSGTITQYQINKKDILERKGMRPTWAEIDLDALIENIQLIKEKVIPSRIFPVIKADAYGHGAKEISSHLKPLNLPYVCVALLEEAIELQNAGYTSPILIIGPLERYQIAEAVHRHFSLTAHRIDIIEEIERESMHQRKRIPFHIKIDSGMGRLGFLPGEATRVAHKLKQLQFSYLEGAFSNFSSADEPQKETTRKQMKIFSEFIMELKKNHVYPKMIHLANSSAILNFPQSWLDAVRPGLLIYGINPPSSPFTFPVQPVLSLKSRIISLKNLPKGSSIGYGEKFRTRRRTLVGIVPIGYDDGIMRSLYPGGEVLVKGKRVPIIGSISMDLTAIDLTDRDDITIGEVVTLIGRDASETLSLSEIALRAKTIPYEILCRMGRRVPRVYRWDKKIRVIRSGILPEPNHMIFS